MGSQAVLWFPHTQLISHLTIINHHRYIQNKTSLLLVDTEIKKKTHDGFKSNYFSVLSPYLETLAYLEMYFFLCEILSLLFNVIIFVKCFRSVYIL